MYNGKTQLTCESVLYNSNTRTTATFENIWPGMNYSDTSSDTAYIGDTSCSFIGFMSQFAISEGSSSYQIG